MATIKMGKLVEVDMNSMIFQIGLRIKRTLNY